MNELFNNLTINLLKLKYEYYVLDETSASDAVYDSLERHWYKLGRELDLLKEDETSPCVGFDYNHPLAGKAIK